MTTLARMGLVLVGQGQTRGSAARQIVEKYWDAKSDQQVIYHLKTDLAINDNLVLQVLKDLAIRFPAMNEEIKSLKNN